MQWHENNFSVNCACATIATCRVQREYIFIPLHDPVSGPFVRVKKRSDLLTSNQFYTTFLGASLSLDVSKWAIVAQLPRHNFALQNILSIRGWHGRHEEVAARKERKEGKRRELAVEREFLAHFLHHWHLLAGFSAGWVGPPIGALQFPVICVVLCKF